MKLQRLIDRALALDCTAVTCSTINAWSAGTDEAGAGSRTVQVIGFRLC